MNALERVRERRAGLVERAARERDALAERFAPWERGLSAVDRVLGVFASVRRNAGLVGTGLGVAFASLAVVRPASIVGWVARGLAAWGRVRSLRG